MNLGPILINISMQVQYIKPDFNNELGEFQRLGISLTLLRLAYAVAPLITLTDSIWSQLENTDSWYIRTPSDVQQAIQDNSASSGTRDIKPIVAALRSGRIDAPIILRQDPTYTLVAGNTRLMLCKLFKLRPKVVCISLR